MKLTVYMRNVENTMDIELPLTINVKDEVKFKEWMAIVVTRSNRATKGDVRLPPIWELQIPMGNR